MFADFILFLMLGGLPYFIYLEKSKKITPKNIFLLSAAITAVGLAIYAQLSYAFAVPFLMLALISAMIAFYRANKTTNLYKTAYLMLFFNVPLMMLSQVTSTTFYGVSLLVTLSGLFLMGTYYEKNYGSANYQPISGMMLVSPFAALFATIYLTTLSLYPPFPNALLFFHTILEADISFLWYITVIVIFFGNFLIGAKIMAKTVFGKPNHNMHYIDLSLNERWMHFGIVTLLLLLSLVGLKELLS